MGKNEPRVGDRARYTFHTGDYEVGLVRSVKSDVIRVEWSDHSVTSVRPAAFIPAKSSDTATEWEIKR